MPYRGKHHEEAGGMIIPLAHTFLAFCFELMMCASSSSLGTLLICDIKMSKLKMDQLAVGCAALGKVFLNPGSLF